MASIQPQAHAALLLELAAGLGEVHGLLRGDVDAQVLEDGLTASQLIVNQNVVLVMLPQEFDFSTGNPIFIINNDCSLLIANIH